MDGGLEKKHKISNACKSAVVNGYVTSYLHKKSVAICTYLDLAGDVLGERDHGLGHLHELVKVLEGLADL